MNVWILRYLDYRNEDAEIIGVYATEEMARHDGIIEAKKNPNIRPYEVKWNGTHMVYNSMPTYGKRGHWLEVPSIVLEEWDVTE